MPARYAAGNGGGRLHEPSGACVCRQQAVDLTAKRCIRTARLLQVRRARGGALDHARLGEDRLFVFHPAASLDSRYLNNHARAYAHWRLAVAMEVPIASAASSIVSPAKYRSFTS